MSVSKQQTDRRTERTNPPQVAPALGPALAGKAALVGEAVQHNLRARAANTVLARGEEAIAALGAQWGRSSDAQLAGRVAEQFHPTTFEAAAALQGRSDLSARTTASLGRGHDPCDVELLRGGKVVDGAQVKYRSTGRTTARELSAPGYEQLQKVVPADQLDTVRQEAGRQALRNAPIRPEQSARYSDTAQQATDRLQFEGVSSRPLELDEAHRLAREARSGKVRLDRVPERSVVGEVLTSAGTAALAGGALAGGFTLLTAGVSNAIRASDGKMTAGEAVTATARSTGLAVLDGSAKTAAGSLMQAGAGTLARTAASAGVRTVSQAVGRSNVLFAVASVAVDAVKGGYQLAGGKIDGTEYALRVGESATGAAGGWGGAMAGAAIGSALCPVVGTILGGIIGGLGGGLGAGALFRKIFRG